MRNNSLRQQVWQNKQHHNIFKKVAQLTPNPPLDQKYPLHVQQNGDKNSHHQHSQIQWLEKLVSDMNNFKQAQKADTNFRQTPIERRSPLVHKLLNQQQSSKNVIKINLSKQSKERNSKQEDPKRIKHKLKFQIISHKENRIPSQKKVSHTNSKSNHKIITKSNKPNPHQTTTNQNQKLKIQQIRDNTRKKDQKLSKLVTESFAFKQSLAHDNDSLWKNDMKDDSLQKDRIGISQEKAKKSIGKIVKNSLNETIIQQIASKSFKSTPKMQKYLQSKQKPHQHNTISKQISQKKAQKVYIKLQTQKLSKYLMQSEVKEVTPETNHQQQNNIPKDQFAKYYLMKRGDHMLISCFDNSRNRKSGNNAKTQAIQKKQTYQKQANNNQTFVNYGVGQIKQNKGLSDKKQAKDYFEIPTPPNARAKSQQRKFNQLSRTHNESISGCIKLQQAQIMPSFGFTNKESAIRNHMKSHIMNIQLQQSNPSNLQSQYKGKKQKCMQSQKIFTLNSDNQQKGRSEQKQAQTANFFPTSIMLNQVQSQDFLFAPDEEPKFQSIEASSNMNHSNNIRQTQEYTQMLKQLFKFLDQAKSYLLTSSNCKADFLTEWLKLLLSPIINQIKSKKKTYDLEQFIAQGKSVLKIKEEVYKTGRASLENTKFSQILQQNIEILIKGSPSDGKQQNHTNPYYKANSNLKRKSTKDSHEVVGTKSKTVQKLKNYKLLEPVKRLAVKKNIQQRIDLQEPQLYFQQKYAISTSRFEQQTVKNGQPLQEFRMDFQSN